ncbi:BlaI/MecI/CopY family transcriptional regulator [Streptomyces sp. NPDC005486]|uniref:BlaI/MecI/CopY family transcriptional regulator n=1 Tax=Streptomyces sp. NPDC005486 TaxID=3155345 RepID=UPI0033B188E5
MTDHRQPRRRRGQGELEALVLSALREADGPATAGWVRERLGGGLAHTTVITVLTRLLAKGAVTRERGGRSFAWLPASDEAGLAAHRMRRVLDAEQDREAVLASFVTGLGPDDERLLRELLGHSRDEDEDEEGNRDRNEDRDSGEGTDTAMDTATDTDTDTAMATATDTEG